MKPGMPFISIDLADRQTKHDSMIENEREREEENREEQRSAGRQTKLRVLEEEAAILFDSGSEHC